MVIPDGVRSAVLGRVSALHRAERSVVTCASVIGQRFELAVLLHACARNEPEVRAALDHACALELVVAEDEGCGCFAFRHAMTRDVIYAEAIASQTRRLHGRIARALERLVAAGGEQLDDLAYHAWAAGDAVRGRRYNELAGDRAATLHAREDAHAYYARARGLTSVDSHAFVRLTRKLDAIAASDA